MANKVQIEVEARFQDNVTGKTKSADESIKKLGKTADQTQKKLDDLGKNTRKVVIDGSADKLVKKLDAMEKKVKSLTKNKVVLKLGATDQATAVINKVTSAAKSFAGKTFRGILAIKDSGALSTLNKINNTAKNLTGKTWQTVVTIKDMATAPLNKIKNTLFSIKSLVLAITAGWAANQFIASPVQTADTYTGAQIGFSTLLGDSAGQQMMDDLDQFAKESPFTTGDVIQNTQKMLAMGWDAETIIDDMRTIGDAAAATGKGTQGLDQITLALAQIQTKGKVSAEELNQLAEAGISAKRYLAEGLGYGGDDAGLAKLYKDLEGGNVYAQEGLAAILEGMKEFEGMMDATANETVGGLISQLSDAYEISVKRRWGQGLQDGFKQALGSMVDLTETAEDGLTDLGDMLYDLGAKASGFVADKFANAVERVNQITDTFEFSNATLGEKFSMLWKGVIADPLGEWWDDHKADFAAKAGEIGADMGKMLSDGIKGLLGITDVFDDTDLSASGGASIAQSFAKGFVENFDVSGIGQKIVDAIGNVWGALPTWAKVLVGGYGASKAITGLGSLAAGAGSLIGAAGAAKTAIGGTGTAMVAGSGLLGGLASTGYALTGGAAGSALSGGMAALVGGGTILGGVAGGASAIKGIADLWGAGNALKEGNIQEAQAKGASGSLALGGAATGAAIGTMILPGIGTALGAGIGGIAGWIGGNKWADSIRTAKVESEELKEAMKDSSLSAEEMGQALEKATWENMKKNLGDIKLTASEISRIADQIVWGKDLTSFETFKSAKSQAEAAVKALNQYGAATDKWMWKASLGVKFNEDEVESIVEQFNGYIEEAKNVVESEHYQFTAAVEMLIDTDKGTGKDILDSGNAYYKKLEEQVNSLGEKLSKSVNIALKDGVISLDEGKEIANLQKQIAEITEKVSQAESSAKMDLIKLKFGKGSLDLDSFNNLMAEMQATIDERMTSSDEAFTVALSGLKLQLADGAISDSEYKTQVEALIEGYKTTIDSVKAEVMGVEIDLIANSGYGEMIKGDAKAKLKSAIEQALKTDVDPIEWSPDDVRRMLGTDSLTEEAATALSQMMSTIYQQLDALDLNVDGLLDDSLDDTYFRDILVEIDPDPRVTKQVELSAEELGVSPEYAAAVAVLLSGDKKILKKIDVSKLAAEFGVPKSQVETVIEKLNGQKEIGKKISVIAEDFGVPNVVSKTVTVAISAVKSFAGWVGDTVGGFFGKARGGIVGGDTIPGYASGGMTSSFGPQLAMVGEEGPEMIIPLNSQRRNRALKLWAMAGHMMDVPGFARGGVTDGSSQDEGVRFTNYGDSASAPSGNTEVNVGGISVQISVDASGGQNVAEAIQAQGAEIAETVAGILADALTVQFENTPTLGGAR